MQSHAMAKESNGEILKSLLARDLIQSVRNGLIYTVKFVVLDKT